MPMKYILYNPFSGEQDSNNCIDTLKSLYKDYAVIDMSHISSYKAFFYGLEEDADIIICGGDGTLNRFVNDTSDIEIKNSIYYYPIGTGNDFARDLGFEKYSKPEFCINRYLKELPTVTVNGKEQAFINNVGFGIDGYCCEVGDKLRLKNQAKKRSKPVNYTAVAVKGLLFNFEPRTATVTVDGKSYTYKNVWLAPVMNGRFYGGGMMPTPNQQRLCKERTVSVMVFSAKSKLRALTVFPSIFKGEHIKYTKNVTVYSGNDITVKFDRPTPLQIDGETISDVTSFSVNTFKQSIESNTAKQASAF